MADSVPEMMQACQVVEFNQTYKIHQIPVPKDLGPHDLLVKVAVASLCHTDAMVRAGTFGTKLPCTGSHEGGGRVVRVGGKVQGFKIGDRVMIGIPFHFCGSCDDCTGPENYRQYCQHEDHTGVTRDGCFAEYAICDSRTSARLPDTVEFETAAPLACAGSTVFRGVRQAELSEGEWLGVVGSGGGLGHLALQFARALSLHTIAIDARDEGLALSSQHKADLVLDARKGKEELVKAVQEVTDGMGVHATLNLSDAETAAGMACAITRMHGTVVQIAQPENVCIPFAELVFRDIRLKGSLICSPSESREMLDVVAKHGIEVQTNIFHGLEEIPKLVELAESGKMKGKGVVVVDGGLK